jgi:hypothetical protein
LTGAKGFVKNINSFFGVSPNGKATDSDSVTLGSNPGTPAIITTGFAATANPFLFGFLERSGD